MYMKKMIFLLFAASLVLNAIKAQVFIIERGSNTSLAFNNIKSAVDALEDNDRLYLPPGEISLSGYTWHGYEGNENQSNTLLVNKNVSIYGAGCADGASSTIIKDGFLIIGKDANGSFVTGIRFNSNVQLKLHHVSNIMVSRCKIDNYLELYDSGNNNLISECEIGSTSANHTYGEEYMSATFSKCIFHRAGSQYFRFANVYNSLFIGNPYFAWENSSFLNNVIVLSQSDNIADTYTINSKNCTYSYNLWVGAKIRDIPDNNNTFSLNITEEPYSNVFVDPANGDYHLKTECQGKNAASDGRDMGIFGTVNPFKESRLPLNPHFSLKVVSPETDTAGKLPVNIKIEAQDN
jgi:hypothetical protein